MERDTIGEGVPRRILPPARCILEPKFVNFIFALCVGVSNGKAAFHFKDLWDDLPARNYYTSLVFGMMPELGE